MSRYLNFDDLSEEEQDQYMALVNKIDGKILEKFVKGLAVKGAILAVTGGLSIFISGPVWIYRFIKKSVAVDNARAYVNQLKNEKYRDETNWNSFPAAHVVLGGEKRSNSAEKVRCPICKQKTLQVFSADYNRDIMSCSNCNKNIVIKFSGIDKAHAQLLIVPGIGSVAIAELVEHVDFGDLSIFFDGLVDAVSLFV